MSLLYSLPTAKSTALEKNYRMLKPFKPFYQPELEKRKDKLKPVAPSLASDTFNKENKVNVNERKSLYGCE